MKKINFIDNINKNHLFSILKVTSNELRSYKYKRARELIEVVK